ncbi:MAG: DUF4350 domain-containing protein [Proteobacteria bacterium]|nr:DUF4350 domain-containing protein [Pseudomonadota bacterium]
MKWLDCPSSRTATLVLAMTVVAVPSARGQVGQSTSASEDTGDYDTDSERWNGLHTLHAVAKGLGLRVEAISNIDWEDLDSDDILFILYPKGRLDPGHMAAFVRNGGLLFLADDFGDSTEALGRLGMLRDPAMGVGAERFYRELSFVPMARPLLPGHPLAAGVAELATNHPAVLTRVRGPDVVFGFGPGEGIIAAGGLGRGRFVVSSDPSVFINRMLQFEGNLQFAVNALRFLSAGKDNRRLIVLAGNFDMYGEPTGGLDDGTVSGTMSNILSEFNRWLDECNDYLLTTPGMIAVALILAIVVGVLVVLSLPLGRKTLFDGSWTRAYSLAPTLSAGSFEEIVGQHDQKSPRGNYLLPAAVIRDTVNARLSRILGERDPLHSHSEASLLESVDRASGRDAARALDRLLRRIKPLPSRSQAASPWSSGYLSQREFERLERDAGEFFRASDRAIP